MILLTTSVLRINDKLAEIKHLADSGDDEEAHAKQDELYVSVLEAIAVGAISGEDIVTCCKAALTAQDIAFSRWYA